MKITREALKTIVKETMIEESEYQDFFKRALEKAGGSIPKMSEEEKKAFFNKIEKTWKGKGEKNEISETELEEAQSPAQKAAFAKMLAAKDGKDVSDDDSKDEKEEVKESNINEAFGNDRQMKILHTLLKDKKFMDSSDFNSFFKKLQKDSSNYFKGETFSLKKLHKDYKTNPKGFKYDDNKYRLAESVNEAEIKVGSSVTVNYPTLKKPVKGKVKHILKSPTGLVYVLDGDKGVWDAKNVSESVNEEITLNSPSFKKLVIYLQKLSDKNGNDWNDLVTKLASKYRLETYTTGTNPAAYVVNFFSITKGKDKDVKKKPSNYIEIGEWYVRPW